MKLKIYSKLFITCGKYLCYLPSDTCNSKRERTASGLWFSSRTMCKHQNPSHMIHISSKYHFSNVQAYHCAGVYFRFPGIDLSLGPAVHYSRKEQVPKNCTSKSFCVMMRSSLNNKRGCFKVFC